MPRQVGSPTHTIDADVLHPLTRDTLTGMLTPIRSIVVSVALLLAACTGGGGVATTGTAETTTSETTTTLADTTTTSPPAPTVTEASTTTTAPQASEESVLAVVNGALARVHLPDGDVETIIEDFEEPGVYRGGIREMIDGRIFYIEGWEDYWYTCDASRGRIGFVDPADPAFTEYSFGTNFAVSPDGASMVVVDSRLCLPDPYQDSWVVTPGNALLGDGVVSFEILLEADPEPLEFETGLNWVAWEDADHVVVVDLGGTVRRVPISAEHVEDGEVLLEELDGFAGLLVDGSLWVHRFEELTSALVAMDLSTGEETVIHEGDDPLLVARAPGGGVITAEPMGSVLTIRNPDVVAEIDVSGVITGLGSTFR